MTVIEIELALLYMIMWAFLVVRAWTTGDTRTQAGARRVLYALFGGPAALGVFHLLRLVYTALPDRKCLPSCVRCPSGRRLGWRCLSGCKTGLPIEDLPEAKVVKGRSWPLEEED